MGRILVFRHNGNIKSLSAHQYVTICTNNACQCQLHILFLVLDTSGTWIRHGYPVRCYIRSCHFVHLRQWYLRNSQTQDCQLLAWNTISQLNLIGGYPKSRGVAFGTGSLTHLNGRTWHKHNRNSHRDLGASTVPGWRTMAELHKVLSKGCCLTIRNMKCKPLLGLYFCHLQCCSRLNTALRYIDRVTAKQNAHLVCSCTLQTTCKATRRSHRTS